LRAGRLTIGRRTKKEPRQTARLWKVYREETPRKGKTPESVENKVSLQRTKTQDPIQPYTITGCYGVWPFSGRRASWPTSQLRDGLAPLQQAAGLPDGPGGGRGQLAPGQQREHRHCAEQQPQRPEQ